MGAARKSEQVLAGEIVGRLARRHSTAVVLFHHVVAERLGPTDRKCLDLVRELGATAGSDLSAITGLTSGEEAGESCHRDQEIDLWLGERPIIGLHRIR